MMEITVLQSLKILRRLKNYHSVLCLKEYKQKYDKLDNLKARIESNKKRKKEVLTNVSDIYNELYYIYKNKYNKKIDTLSAENKNLLDNK